MNLNNAKLIFMIDPDGNLNISHYNGVLKQLQQLQYEYQTIILITDLKHINQQQSKKIIYKDLVTQIVIDCLISGIDPSQTIICIQSKIPELSELQQIIGAITPLGWLERVQNYKEIIDQLDHTELSTYGLLGVPLIYSSIVLGFDSSFVLESEDNISCIELSREIARRFNYIYGREEGFEEKARESILKLGDKKSELYLQLLTKFQQDGDEEASERARYLLEDANNIAFGDRERLIAFLENKGKVYLNEPQKINAIDEFVGIDGQQMSNNNDNTISLRENSGSIADKIRLMPTDPARVRRSDNGNPKICSVWKLHQKYSNSDTINWVEMGCLSAAIGCIDCKQSISDTIVNEQLELEKLAQPYLENPILVKRIINEGCAKASSIVAETLLSIKNAININY